MNIKNFFKKSNSKENNAGFTLIELLVASFMGVVVIGAAGMGLMNLLRGNQAATAQSTKRSEVNRALDFISDEVRVARSIELDPSNEFTTAQADGDIDVSKLADAQAVLALNIPNIQNPEIPGADSPIIYFLSSVQTGDESVWKGPRVIYRFGPPIDASGNYTNGNWTVEPLIDGISNDAVTADCGGWTAVPAAPQRGFYACVRDPNPGTATAGETARIFAIGQLKGEDYLANTQVFARAKEEELAGADPNRSYCRFVAGVLMCSPGGGGGGSPTYTIDTLGSFFACNSSGGRWNVNVEVYSYDDSTTPPTENLLLTGSGTSPFSVTSALPIIFKAVPDTTSSPDCGADAFTSTQQNQTAVSSLDTNQVVQLFDGSEIETTLEKGYVKTNGTQVSAKNTLQAKGLIDSDTDRVNLEENQYVFAFEMGQTNPTAPGFDQQDHILLITVEE